MGSVEDRARLLVVDDQLENRMILNEVLSSEFNVITANDGEEALEASQNKPELILLDIMMPRMDGLEVCRRIKEDPSTRDIPVIFLTSLDRAADEARALSLGAEDFVHKPFSPPVVLARVRNHLALARARRELKRSNEHLETLVEERTRQILQRESQLVASQEAIIMAFCSLAESRDNETGNHIRRTQHYVRALAEKLQHNPRFEPVLDNESVRLMFKSAPLHDIGKVAIPDSILMKPGRLDPGEWTIMKTHCKAGRDVIARVAGKAGDDFLRFAMEIAYSHHERWDGSGYPEGLAGDEIPLSARLMAVADVYDALISRRAYKPYLGHEESISIMAGERGGQFDPDILDELLADSEVFRSIAFTFADADQLDHC